MSERITENIIRNHFNKFIDMIHIEEQQSKNLIIKKLLATASKKCTGNKGYPEFIISFKDNSKQSLLIVLECKAKISDHESINRNQYDKFAVDGVLFYAAHLAREFDVLAIAVSGDNIDTMKVSHFLHLKKQAEAIPIFSNQLLSPKNYYDTYQKSPEKNNQDTQSLLAYAKKLNEQLHTYKISEDCRSLLISCILIALEDEAFKLSYAIKTTAKDLADFLTQTVTQKLKHANINGDKLENLNVQFSFIKTDMALANKPNILKDLITEINANINQFIKTHQYYDVLGQLYIEFLRYANGDKSLGIVLTPPHIAELFTKLANVNKDSIIFDNCTGTGGFLIAAMKEMILDAKDDVEKIRQIKTHQLIGVEFQARVFALAVSNMYIHQDGKTNIINGSCFDKNIIDEVKKQKPTVGFLNPPYKADKKNDIEELEFVLNNLECLMPNGVCIAILPMQSGLAQSGKILELKKQLLAKHKLEAVLSMPNELFFNSNVSVVSCVMIFTAHKPHNKHKNTYFGYYKDDGFVKRKIQGRIDLHNKWGKEIEAKWVNSFINRTAIPGFSSNYTITAEDEWCAEAYLDTDYTNITEDDFNNTVLDYAVFLMANKLELI